MHEDAALETLASEVRAQLDQSVVDLNIREPLDDDEPADDVADERARTPEEMRDRARRELWSLMTNKRIPPHVRIKAASEVAKWDISSEEPIATDTASVFEMVESLPPARGIELLERKEQTILAELEAVRTQRSKLLIQQDRDASQVA